MFPESSLTQSLPVHMAPHVLDSMPIPMICFNKNFEALYFNPTFAVYVELESARMDLLASRGGLKAADIFPKFHPSGLSSLGMLAEKVEEARRQGVHESVCAIRSFNGSTIMATMSVTLVQEKGKFFICCYFTPVIREHKTIAEPSLSQEALVHLNHVTAPAEDKTALFNSGLEKEFEQECMDSLPFIMHVWSKEGELLDCSVEVTTFFGVADKEEFKEKYFTLCPETQLGKSSSVLMQEYVQKAFDEGFCKFKWLHNDVQGKLLPCEVTLSRSSHAGESCVLGFTQDLTGFNRQVQEFGKIQESTRAMLDAAPIAVTLWNNQYTLLDANSECARLFGFESSEAFLQEFRAVIPEFQEDGTPSITMARRALDVALESGYHRSDFSAYHYSTQALIPLEITLVRLIIWNEDLVVAYIRDLRDVKALIHKMQSTEERIQTIFNITPLGINVWDRNYALIECNDAIVDLYGFSCKEEYLATRYRIMPRLQPDGTPTVPMAHEVLEETFKKGFSHIEMLTQDLQGNPIPVEVSSKKTYVQQQEVVVSYVRDMRDMKAKLAVIHATEKELRTARDMAEQSAQAKAKFLGNISHEIRTPLHAVLGLLHVLDGTALQPAQRDYVYKSIQSTTKLVNLINNVLDFSKIDTGTFELETEAFTLKEIVDEALIVFGPQATAKGIVLHAYTDDTAEDTLYGDMTRLKQVLFNVLSNAVKFTEEGHITLNIVCTEKQGDGMHYLFSVEDSGIGMTRTQCMQVFSAFAQADSSITRKYEGAGLGLAIAKRIAKLMHGDMWVKSQKGKGSTFFISAIFMGEEQTDHAFHGGAMHRSAKEADTETAETLSISQASTKTSQSETPGKQSTILLVEDNVINQFITVELLKGKGYDVDVASDGKEALSMVKEKSYDMVLMDIQMPHMDGLTATTKIRALKKFENLPIVAMSAHAMSGDKELSLQYGMNEHLSKPIEPDLLYATVEKWCNSASLSDNEWKK